MFRPIVFALASLAIAAAAGGQPSDATARMERVADGVYAIIHEHATDYWPHGNTGVIIGDDGVLVIDSTYLPSRARADIALIRQLTDKPVKYLVMTHWHFDHNNGNSAYREAFPSVAIVSERNTARWIEINNTWWPKMSTAPDSDRRAQLAQLEHALVSGVDESGAKLTGDAKAERATVIAQRKAELAELATLKVVAPDLLFDESLTLHLGRRRVDVRAMGRANSPNDSIIYLPEEKILFTGDIVVQSPLPYLGASWPVQWVDVLRELESLPATAIVPGHGPVMPDHSYVARVRSLIDDTLKGVEAMIRDGKTLAQIQAGLDLSRHRRAFAPWESASDAAWKANMDALIDRAWRGIRGQG